jgi:hypothetical protein
MKRYTILVEFIVYALGVLLVGEVTADTHPDSLQSSIEEQEKYSIGVFPVIFYSDETRLAGGAAAQVVYGGPSRRYSSSIGMIGFYTQNKQYNSIPRTSNTTSQSHPISTGKRESISFPVGLPIHTSPIPSTVLATTPIKRMKKTILLGSFVSTPHCGKG